MQTMTASSPGCEGLRLKLTFTADTSACSSRPAGEHLLAKERVAGSNPVFRSRGRHLRDPKRVPHSFMASFQAFWFHRAFPHSCSTQPMLASSVRLQRPIVTAVMRTLSRDRITRKYQLNPADVDRVRGFLECALVATPITTRVTAVASHSEDDLCTPATPVAEIPCGVRVRAPHSSDTVTPGPAGEL